MRQLTHNRLRAQAGDTFIVLVSEITTSFSDISLASLLGRAPKREPVRTELGNKPVN
jgi:hypothetical protein